MKPKRIAALIAIVLGLCAIAGCSMTDSSTESTDVSQEVSTGDEVNEDADLAIELPDEEGEVVSGTIAVPIEEIEDAGTESTDNTIAEADGMVTTKAESMYYSSELTGTEAVMHIPEEYQVNYSDEYVLEVVKPFPKDTTIDYYDEENEITYFEEIIVTNFNNIRNTPFCEAEDYIKAQLMNTGYDYIYDLKSEDRDFIVAYTEINREVTEDTLECLPKTSIVFLWICNDSAACQREDCTHAEVIEAYVYIYDILDEQGVIEYVSELINNCGFDVVVG